MLKRIFALILTLILTVVSIPIQAIAAEIGEWIPSPELPTSSGEVGLIDPVQVEVVNDLIVDLNNYDPALDYADLTPDASGITGECTWALYGTELVISGNGKMADYTSSSVLPWGTSITKVTIESGVTNISQYAFLQCAQLFSVSISNSVVSIGDYAFFNCSALTSVTIPDSVTYIGTRSFANCKSMTSITLSKNLISTGSATFSSCSGLTNVVIPGSMKSIAEDMFNHCTGLTSVTISSGVTEIGANAFNYCTALQNISFPETIRYVDIDAFYACNKVKRADAPDVLSWLSIAFADECSNPLSTSGDLYINGTKLTDLVIPDTVTEIHDYAFYGYTLTSVYIPKSVKKIGVNAFFDSRVKKVSSPDLLSWLSIEFENGSSNPTEYSNGLYVNGILLTDLMIPDTVTRISQYAFYWNSALKSVYIPESVTEIGAGAFTGCSGITRVDSPDLAAWSSIEFENLGSNPVNNCGRLYFNGSILEGKLVIPETVTRIGSYAFLRCDKLTEVVVPDSVQSIGIGAFSKCAAITSITLPFVGDERKTSNDTNQYPLGYIFGTSSYTGGKATAQYYYGTNLSKPTSQTYYIPNSLKNVTVTDGDLNYGAFYNCNNIEKIIIGEGVNNIVSDAFYGMTSLIAFEVAEANLFYSTLQRRLYNKDKTELIWSPENYKLELKVNCLFANGEKAVDSIVHYYKEGEAYSAEIPEIKGYSPNYSEISGTMPAYDLTIDVIYYENETVARGECNSEISWTLYAEGTLMLRGSGEMPDYTSGTAPWAAYADKVQSVYVDSSITHIGAYSFENCVNLTFIDYGYGIKSIGEYAFKNCSALTSFKLPSTVNSISEGAFSGCIGLQDVVIPDNITAIGANAFNGCGGLIKVTIGGAVTEIGSDAFANCANLTQIYFRGKPATLGNNAFGSANGKFVYYYSTVSGWDEAVTDGKYYGYTAIPYNAISKENFDGTNPYIIKVVDKYNVPVVGATVYLGSEAFTTVGGGMAYFVKPTTVQKLRITCPENLGFVEFTDNEFSATTTQIMDIIELSDKPSVVQGVRADGKSIATSVVTVNSASGNDISITVSGYSKYTIIKYELYQGTRLISTIKTSATEATFKVAASAFEEGETVVVRMYSSDGNMVATALNIDVVKLAKINENQVLTELSDISMDVNMGTLGSFKFELPFTRSDAPNLKVYTKGRSIFVGINMDPKDIETKKLSKSDIVKSIDKTLKNAKFDDEDASIDFCGYLEIEYLGNGEYYIKSSYVKMRVEVNFETQLQASFYGIVGVYFKIGIGAAGQLELKIARFEPDTGFAFEQADITLETIMDLEVGAYLLWGAGSAGVYGTITIGFTIGVVPVTEWKQVYAKGELGVRWSVLWGMIKGEYAALEGDFFRWTNDGVKSLMAQVRRAMRDPSSYTQNDRSYLENRSEWLSGSDENTLQTSIYGEVAPKIVSCGDTTMMVWLDDNGERDFDNFQTLYYSICNDGVWSAPVAVDNNDTFDCEFDVYSDGNSIYVVYTEMMSRYADMQSLDITDISALQALIGNVEVMVAVYENGEFSDPVRLTNNAICEQIPVIGEVDGYITAAWLESNSMGFDDAQYENDLVISVLDVIGWTAPETAVSGNNTISDIVNFSLDGEEYLAYIVDADGSSDTVDDKILVLRGENGDSVQLDSGSIASAELCCVAGSDVLTWYNGNQLYMMGDIDGAPISLLPENIVGSRDYQIVNIDDEKSLLLFTDNTETEGSDIFGMYIGANGALTSPVRMTETEGYIASYAVYNENGDYFVVYNETQATVSENNVETISSLRIAKLDFGCDIKINSVEYDLTEAYPNSDFELIFTISNEGSNHVDGIKMNFFDAQGGLIYTSEAEVSLESGESGEISFSVVLPQSIAAEAYTAEILPMSKMAVVPDSDPESNRVEIMLAFSDMSISAEQKIIGEKNYVLFSVTNEGNTASTAMLYVYAEGRLIAELKTDSIPPATSSQYLIDIHALTSADDKILTCSVKSDFYDNCSLNDNDSLYLLHIEDSTLAVDPDDAIRNPELSAYIFEFDKYTPENIELLIIAEADYFKSITGLTKDVDYTIDYDALTINGSVFAGLEEGIHTFDLVFDFDGASVTRSITVSVTDTTPITIIGSISIAGEIVVGDVVYADISGLTPTRPEVNYVWTIDGVTVGNEDSYLIKASDYGKTLVLTVEAGEGFAGSFEVSAVISMRKETAPNTPIVSSIDSGSITLVRVNGVEYSLDGATWQTENSFEGLAPNAKYTVYARRSATDTTLASDAVYVTVTTKKLTVASPEAPKLQGKSHDTISLVSIEGMEYKIEGGEWTDNPVFTGLDPVTEYRFYQRYKETETAYASEAASASFTTDRISVLGVVLDEALIVNTYETKTLNWSILPSNATYQNVTFTSSDPEIATVNANGEVRGVKEGHANITITTADGGFTDTCAVTVICSHANILSVPEQESDCKNAGWDAYSVCDDCGRLFDAYENELDDIPYRALNDIHVGGTELLNYSEPDHITQTDGYTGDIKCLGCGDIIEYGRAITVDPHEEKDEWATDGESHWKNCSICGTTIDSTIDAHSECDEWTTDGENHWKNCSICDCVIDSTYDVHTEAEWVELDDGSRELRCDVCGVLLDSEDAPEPITVMLGDVNNDGVVNQYDYILIKRHYFETRILNDDEMVRADVNKDNKVDQYDYILVARHYFGTYEIK